MGITAPAWAGTVTVAFLHPQTYSDTGTTSSDRDRHLQTLAQHLQGLGARLLPPDQVLKLEVLDVDLAGTVQHFYRSGQDVRVMNGRADWPRIQLRYTLGGNDGAVLRSGEETVADMNYLGPGTLGRSAGEALAYEKQMLEKWFQLRWVEGR
jgi:hypothetical protein